MVLLGAVPGRVRVRLYHTDYGRGVAGAWFTCAYLLYSHAASAVTRRKAQAMRRAFSKRRLACGANFYKT